MRKYVTLFLLLLALNLATSSASAQGTNGVSFKYIRYNYVNPNPTLKNWQDIYENAGGSGFQLAFHHKLDKNTYLVVPATVGVGAYPTDRSFTDKLLVNADVLFQYLLLPQNYILNPTLHLGVGTTWDTPGKRADFNLPIGLGLNIRMTDYFSFVAQSQYRHSIQNRNGWQHSVGFVLNMGADTPKDRDGDGISDEMDKCPDVPGLPSLLGCPDQDNDGITDANDKCPDVPGLPELAGCPDQDNDGITDKLDDCPDIAGPAEFKGCPDSDSDGIPDSVDKCPKEAGPESNQGCPFRDRDGDGIEDKDDACPSEKGTIATKGCPDRDADGIADKADACPDKKGLAQFKGCPDTDGDGVADPDDRCVDTPGPVSNKGCPEIKKEDKAKVELAIKAVQFETGKDVLLASSKKVLDEVAAVLIKYPAYSLNISGHTDAVGDDKWNQQLSEKRAKAVADYLISQSVAANRLMSAGYGESKPIADNKTKEGREANRRVEFDLIIK